MQRFGRRKVEHFDQRRAVAAATHHERRRTQVAVNDAERMPFGDALGGLDDVVDGLGDGQRPTHLQHLCQVGSAQILAHHIGSARVESAHVRDASDVLSADFDRRARLANEALHELWIGAGIRDQELERDLLAELQVSHQSHHSQARAPWNAFDAVFAGQHFTFTHDARGHPLAPQQRRPERIVEDQLVIHHYLCVHENASGVGLAQSSRGAESRP